MKKKEYNSQKKIEKIYNALDNNYTFVVSRGRINFIFNILYL